MTELSDWKRAVYEPEKAEFEATIRLLRADLAAARARLPDGWVMARENALREVLLLVDDFHWTLPMYKSRAANEASDDAAEMVKGQICEAISAMLSFLPAPANVKDPSP